MAVSMSSLRLKLFIRSCTFEKPGRFYLKATAFGDEKRTDVTEEAATTAKFKQRLLSWAVPEDAQSQGSVDAEVVVSATQLLFSRGDKVIGSQRERLREWRAPT